MPRSPYGQDHATLDNIFDIKAFDMKLDETLDKTLDKAFAKTFKNNFEKAFHKAFPDEPSNNAN